MKEGFKKVQTGLLNEDSDKILFDCIAKQQKLKQNISMFSKKLCVAISFQHCNTLFYAVFRAQFLQFSKTQGYQTQLHLMISFRLILDTITKHIFSQKIANQNMKCRRISILLVFLTITLYLQCNFSKFLLNFERNYASCNVWGTNLSPQAWVLVYLIFMLLSIKINFSIKFCSDLNQCYLPFVLIFKSQFVVIPCQVIVQFSLVICELAIYCSMSECMFQNDCGQFYSMVSEQCCDFNQFVFRYIG
eukprot:TRINITY_DN34868_c0_g1_i15.p1 TRINITY_DN34868_c0_g1~~TRINITY_DN34868_c0_g1_i15.p1  ORF type:complete len:247 (-),score=-12.75 TRINITY_DN34868_c0_g1_i15:140-880(-)